MKRSLLLLIVIILFVVFNGIEGHIILNYINLSKELYEEFLDNDLVSVDGGINLIQVNSERDELYNEIVNLISGDLDKDGYIEKVEELRSSNVKLDEEIKGLSNEITNLENSKKSLNSQYVVLKRKYDSSYNNEYNFHVINQYPKYYSGCESVSLTMLLRYYGIDVTVDDVIVKLKKGNMPYYENGVLYGGNPELEFIGNPYSSYSYGVYQIPISEVANIYKSGIQVKSDFPFSEVVNIVRGGIPVMVWTSMGMSLPYLSDSWVYKPTMETIYWKANEHAVVVVGIEGNNVVIADPMGGRLKRYSINLFEQRYNYFGKKALYYNESI